MVRTAFIYRRLSQEDKNRINRSLDNQLLDLTNYCKSNDIKILKDYSEPGLTGDAFRPLFNKMIEQAKLIKPTMIIARDSSRFARDISLMVDTVDLLQKLGIKIYSILEGDLTEDIMITGIYSSINEGLKQRGKKAQRAMMFRKMRLGLTFGHPPFGFKKQHSNNIKTWEIIEEEAKVVRELFDKYVNEDLTVNDLLILYNKSDDVVYKILKNKIYCGVFRFAVKEYGKRPDEKGRKVLISEKNYEYDLSVKPYFISKEVWQRAQDKMAKNCRWN